MRGSMTALVTPFKNGAVDMPALDRLIEHQIAAGTQALVIMGTTAEAPTLDASERVSVIERAIDVCRDRTEVIVGTGTNSTKSSIELQAHAKSLGAAAGLVVAPYYNKPSQDGLIAHFNAIANAVELPIIAYNIPARCGVDILPETMAEMAKHPHIIGVKDATGDVSRVNAHRELIGPDFIQLSGDDATSLAYNKSGGDGSISVTANVAPELCYALQSASASKDWATAEKLDEVLQPLHKALFLAPNPCPAKHALSVLGLCNGEVRLPLIEAPDYVKRAVDRALKGCGLL